MQAAHPGCYTGLTGAMMAEKEGLTKTLPWHTEPEGLTKSSHVHSEGLTKLPHSSYHSASHSGFMKVSAPVWEPYQNPPAHILYHRNASFQGPYQNPSTSCVHWGWQHPSQWRGLTKPPPVLPKLTNWKKAKTTKKKGGGGSLPYRSCLITTPSN